MSLDIFVLGVAVIANLILGLIVFFRNPKAWSSKAFLAIAISITVWTVSNYLTDNAGSLTANQFFNRLAFISGFWSIASVYLFTFFFPLRLKVSKNKKYLLLSSFFIVSIFSGSHLVVGDVVARPYGVDVSTGPLYILYLLVMLTTFILTARNMSRARKKANPRERQQVLYIIIGVSTTFVLALFTNAIIPAITTDWEIAKVGPFLTVFFVGWVAYAIIKHRLFDIRFVVARSVAYTLLLTTLGITYGSALFGISHFLLRTEGFETSQVVVNTVLAIILVVTFQPLKRYFDRFTNRIFYRDAYDSQKVLNSISELLASEMKLVRIARKSLALIADSLHLSYGLFIVMGDDDEIYQTERHGSAPHRAPSENMLRRLDENLILKDETKDDEKIEILNRFDAAAALRLKTKEGIVGYILLGPKQSGNIYNQQDVKFLKIVANELSIAVENSRNFEQIQAFNETLQEKVDEATKKLRRTNKKLRQLDEAKDEFITMASHQLRTPLTTIKGYVSMMLEGDAGKITNKQKDMLKAAYTSSDRMVYLIADLLNVSRLSTGKFVIQSKRVNLADIVRSEIDQLERHLEAKNIDAEFNAPDEMPPVELDENKIRQVIMNFIDNAIFYTHEDGKIEVTLEEKGKAIELRVKDNGIGVPKEEQHQLFTKFFRATNAKKARPDGTGLGLYLAKKVITAQGGTVIFESKEGEGSTFGFSFPKDRILVTSNKEEPSETEKANATA